MELGDTVMKDMETKGMELEDIKLKNMKKLKN